MSLEHAPQKKDGSADTKVIPITSNIEILPNPATSPFMVKREVVAYVGLSNRTMLDWERAGRFPKRIVFSTRLVKWSRASIYAWVEEQLASHEV